MGLQADTKAGETERPSALRSLRSVAQAALLGGVTAGILFSWAPVAAAIDVHAVGAVVGAGVGAFAKAKHFI